jgi:uncharacterized protein (TIGR00369 family)
MAAWSRAGVRFAPLPLDQIGSRTGLEILQAILRGELPAPPMCNVLDFGLVEAEKGRAVFEGIPSGDFANPFGAVHGGWAATILDSCMACAVQTGLAAGQIYATAEFKLNLVRPIGANSGRVRAEGKLIHLGSRLATSEGRLTDAEGRLLAHGTETCVVFEAR